VSDKFLLNLNPLRFWNIGWKTTHPSYPPNPASDPLPEPCDNPIFSNGYKMDINRKNWNEGHQKLNQALTSGNRDLAIELFLSQHAMVHSSKMAGAGLWSFEDEILNGLTDQQIRSIPPSAEHSIAWNLLHLARIEDITMNLLVAGTEQIFTKGHWSNKLKVNIIHSANKMDGESLAKLSSKMDITALKSYRITVGRQTRKIVQNLKREDFKQKVQPNRIQKVMDQGAVVTEAMEIIQYWSKKTIAGLLLMPPTRHCILHLNEAQRIRNKLLK